MMGLSWSCKRCGETFYLDDYNKDYPNEISEDMNYHKVDCNKQGDES